MKYKYVLIFAFIITASIYMFNGCCGCGLCTAFADGFKKGFSTATPQAPVKMTIDEINEKGVPEGTYIEIEGRPSYADLVYTFYPSKSDPNTIERMGDIYYPVLSKKQYATYKKTLVKNEDGGYVIDIEKAKSLGLKVRVYIKHNTNEQSFALNSPPEKFTTYKGKVYSGKEIDKAAMDIINTGEIAPLLHTDLILIYME
jgi:hypothetical protein